MRRVYIVGSGMTEFCKPDDQNSDYYQVAEQAIQLALKDACLTYSQIEQAYCGYVYGDSTSG
jgi:sterol carrier protein 2